MIGRRTFFLAIVVTSLSPVAYAVDALPDARFVGFAQTVNKFEIESGNLALTKSQNELVRAYATRSVAESTISVQNLERNRNEAGVTMAPEENFQKMDDDATARLNSLQGAEFDTAYAAAQLSVQTAAVAQFGAYSQDTNNSAPLRRYAQEVFPKSQALLELAKQLSGSR